MIFVYRVVLTVHPSYRQIAANDLQWYPDKGGFEVSSTRDTSEGGSCLEFDTRFS